jgi:type I restriction enzyme M protein
LKEKKSYHKISDERMVKSEMKPNENWLEIGKLRGYIRVFQKDGALYVEYPYANKTYRFDNPEEKVRAEVYVELIEKYDYPVDRIRLEEWPPVREGGRPSDIVVYDPDGFPFLVVETKRRDASEQEIQTGIRELFGNANLFGVRWALFDCREKRIAYFSLVNFSLDKEAELRKPDIPKRYGQPEKFIYGNNIGFPLTPFKEVSEFQKVIKKCHDIIRDNENLSPLSAFPIISRLIYTKIYDELNTPKGKYYNFQISGGESILSVASRIANLYKKASSIEPEVFSPTIGVEKPETIYHIVELLQKYSLYHSPYDVKGQAYQAFLSSLMRGEAGQYFTPREVVKPTVEILCPKDYEKIIDPCCGTGGFLIYAYKYVREYIRSRYKDEKTRIRKEYDVAHYNIFGIEVDPNVAEACIAGMLLEDDAHGHIAIADALSDWNNPVFIKKGIEKNKFNVLLTNPPFGKKSRLKEYQKRFTLAKKFKTPPFEALILERSLELLAPGGRAGFVIPDINLTNKKVLEFLWNNTVILGVVSLPSETFNPYGSMAKTSVIFFRKKREEFEETKRIFMASVFQIGYDATGRRKGDGKNAYEDVVSYFRKFLEGENISPIMDDKFVIFTIEGEALKKAKNNLRVETFLPQRKVKGEFVPLGEVAQVLRGYTPSWHEYTESGIPVLKVRNLTNRFINFSFEGRGHVPREIYEKHPEAHVRLYDILLTASAHKPEYIAKKIDIIDILPVKECMAVAELLIIRPDPKKINPFYLLSVLRMKEINDQFRSCIKGTTAHIYPEDVAQNVLVSRLSRETEEKIGLSLKKSLEAFRKFEIEYAKYEEDLKKIFKEDE